MIFYGYFWICGTCNKPTNSFNICNYLGYNPGTDGHFFNTEEEAINTWKLFKKYYEKDGRYVGEKTIDENNIVKGNLVKDFKDNIEFLERNIKLCKFDINLQGVD